MHVHSCSNMINANIERYSVHVITIIDIVMIIIYLV